GRVPRATAKVVLGRIRTACDEGKPLWCRRLGYWHEHGLSVARDAVKARVFYRKACDDGDGRACTDLGRMLASGEGGPRSEPAAIALLRPACDKGGDSGAACSSLGMILLSHLAETDKTEGARLLDRACETGDALACQRLTSLHVPPPPAEGEVKTAKELDKTRDDKDEARAADLLDKACAAGGERCEEAQKLREKVGVQLE
ncbi:MAG: tetratricopeptide repeat protein, partial [Byssovorax sp.]